jgi:hypothetical protein
LFHRKVTEGASFWLAPRKAAVGGGRLMPATLPVC